MKSNLMIFISLAFIFSMLAGCSTGKSNTVNGATVQTVQQENQNNIAQNSPNEKSDKKSEDNVNQLAEENKAGSIKAATKQSIKAINDEVVALDESKTLNGFTIKLLEIREFTDDFVQSSKDKFIKIKLELTNNGEEEANFSSLRHLSLLANNENQDLAIFTDEKKFEFKLLPKKKMVEEIIFDSKLVDNYTFIIKDPKTNEEIEWVFSNNDILIES